MIHFGLIINIHPLNPKMTSSKDLLERCLTIIVADTGDFEGMLTK